MRRLSSAKERLSEPEIERFLSRHIPYRLRLLHLGLALAPPSGLVDSAAVEAALVHGRQMIQFLGLGIGFPKNAERPSLEEKPGYFSYGEYTDEVKIVNLGGDFQKLSALSREEKETLAEFFHGASKATAHLTEGSGHKLNENECAVFVHGCNLIIRLVTDAVSKLRPAAGCSHWR